MISANPTGDMPDISAEACVHPTAVIMGNVKIGRNVFIGPQSVLRADERESSIVIGEDCNVQDGVIIHALTGTSVLVSERTSLSHGCLIHGPCRIGRNCFIGFKSIVFKTTLSDNVFIGHNLLIENLEVPENSRVGTPSGYGVIGVQDISAIHPGEVEFKKNVLEANRYLVEGYQRMQGV